MKHVNLPKFWRSLMFQNFVSISLSQCKDSFPDMLGMTMGVKSKKKMSEKQ